MRWNEVLCETEISATETRARIPSQETKKGPKLPPQTDSGRANLLSRRNNFAGVETVAVYADYLV